MENGVEYQAITADVPGKSGKSGKSVETTSVDAGAVSPEDLAAKKLLSIKSRGWSMYPLIHHGDMLFIQPGVADTLRTGDIAFFRLSGGSFVVHRLIRTKKVNSLLMNGDSLRDFDEPVLKEQVFGKLTRIEHDGKALSLEGRFNNMIGWFITQLAQYRIPFQITLKQNLARIEWFFRGKRIT